MKKKRPHRHNPNPAFKKPVLGIADVVTLGGTAAGAAAGAIAGPVGMIVGTAIGAEIGAATGMILEEQDRRNDEEDARLDEEIGVTRGSLGANVDKGA